MPGNPHGTPPQLVPGLLLHLLEHLLRHLLILLILPLLPLILIVLQVVLHFLGQRMQVFLLFFNRNPLTHAQYSPFPFLRHNWLHPPLLILQG